MVDRTRASNLENFTRHYLVDTAAAAKLDPEPGGLVCNSAGTATIEDENGDTVLYNLVVGQRIPLQGAIAVTTLGGGCTLIAYH